MKLYQSRVLMLRLSLFVSLIVLGTFLATTPSLTGIAYAQVTTSITPTIGSGDLGTSVSPPAGNVYNITGGTRPGNGSNLFHSFGEFSVGALDTARFLNTTPEILTSNILGRVTGGDPSSILGTIDTLSYGNANLFLMNPAGFLFGPNATVNVGGMVSFTSADYLRLGDLNSSNAGIFHADLAQASILTNAPVAAFGFLGSNPGAITIQGSQFTVTEGAGVSLVGGNITIQSGTLDSGALHPAKLTAPGGQINLVSVVSPGEAPASNFEPTPPMAFGSITLSQGSMLDVSAESAGMIRIRGGQFVITDATLSADTGNLNGASTAMDINVTEDLSITDTRGIPAVTAMTTGTGNAGTIQITSGNLTATTTFLDPSFLPSTMIDTHTAGDGRGGDVSIETGYLTATGTLEGGNLFTFIDSGTTANGRGGDVTIAAGTIELNGATVSTGQLNASAFVENLSTVNGSAGHLTMTADTIRTLDALFDTSALFGTSPLQQGGDISITAHDIAMVNTQVSSFNTNGGGALTIKTDSLVADFTSFEIDTIFGPGGGISVEARVVELTNGSPMISSTIGDGNAGNIQITATDHMSIIGDLGTNELAPFQPSGLFSNSFGQIFGTFGGSGNAGNIVVTTPTLNMIGGRINTVTSGSGNGGNVTLSVQNGITISGEFPSEANIVPSILTNGPLAPSGVVTETNGGANCAGSCGNAGTISISTGFLTLGNGGQIDSGTGNNGRGGNIDITARDTISISGTFSDGSPVGFFSLSLGTEPDSGAGGNIALTAGQSVAISNGASVSASSTGPGNTGNIEINAGNQFTMVNSSVTTEANHASGGRIKITTNPGATVQLTDSTISASVLDGIGGGGSLNIDPLFFIMLDSQLLARAVQGPGGNISIRTNFLLMDATSVISASSQTGVNGTVTIQSPNAPVSGQIQPLGKTPLLATSLLNQHCASLAEGQFSSFTVAGRDSLPTEPGSWLTSPLAMLGTGTGEGLSSLSGLSSVVRTGLAAHQKDQTLLSLRQIAPAGFLTQTFAVDRSAGCHS